MSETATEQRFVFDAIAELYDRARPGYPEALVEATLQLAKSPESARILEIGCGTGQASRPFANRGHALVGIEPGASTAALARVRLAQFSKVEILTITFEAWALEQSAFDLVISAQAFHWVDPALGFSKSHAALRPGGSLAVIGNVTLDTSPIRAELDAAYRQHAPTLMDRDPMAWYSGAGPIPGLFADSGCFAVPEHRAFPWTRSYTAQEYIELLDTYSDHCMLRVEQRDGLLGAVREIVKAHGDRIALDYVAHLHIAKRLEQPQQNAR
jgi:SAM-dependent methyltransferase